MKTLLIDNGSTLLTKLEKLIPGEKIVASLEDISSLSDNNYNLIVLSGGGRYIVTGNENILRPEMGLVQSTQVPIIGICYGCEVIVDTFGGTLEEMPRKEKGIIEVEIIYPDPIFDGKNIVRVYESHQWRIKSLPKDFIVLAKSSHGIEAIRHSFLPIYGFQFHPENFVDKTEGSEVFLKIFNSIAK